MARRELGPASLAVGQAVAALMPAGRVVVGCSGGADSLALVLGAVWAAPRADAQVVAVVVDHGLQPGSGAVADRVVDQLAAHGVATEVRQVEVRETGHGLEAAAREARLAALARDGVPVLLGHTLDDQAETVLLGLLRGSGTRSLSGMAVHRGPFIRPLLDTRRETTLQSCREWGVVPWQDPHNDDHRFMRVRVRRLLSEMGQALERDVAINLARSARLARDDAELLDRLAAERMPDADGDGPLPLPVVEELPAALRLRILHRWLARSSPAVHLVHVLAVDALITDWHGQRGIDVPGATIRRVDGQLVRVPHGREAGPQSLP